jgi:N-acetylmuramoyl-L-alanine amidase
MPVFSRLWRFLLPACLVLTAVCFQLFGYERFCAAVEDFDPPASILANEVDWIAYKPIPFGKLRRELTLDYIRAHCDPAATNFLIDPKMIVIHWTGSPRAESAISAFRPEVLPPGRPELLKGGRLNVSAHFIVDRDGKISQLMPENWMARHTIGLNRVAIGIENAGGPDLPLTSAQLSSNAALVRKLVQKYPGITFLIGHYEYKAFRKTPLWQERDPSYITGKLDPGPEFMAKLREATKDLGLSGSYGGGGKQAGK